MAEDKKDIVKKFNQDLDVLNDNLNNIANTLSTSMRNTFSDLTTDAGNFIDEFERGENISRKLNSKLLDLQKTSNRLGTEKMYLESDYAKALANGNIREQVRINKKLLQNNLANQQLDSTQTILNKLSQTVDAENKISEEKEKQNSLSSIILSSTEKTFGFNVKNTKEMFTLSGIMALIVSKALQFNKISVELSKNLGYASGKSDRLLYGLAASSVSSNNLNFNSKYAAEAIGQISEATGYVAEFSQDALETQIMLTKQFGLTGAEAARIYELSVLTGKSSKQVNDEMVGAFVATRNQLKVGVPFKATIAAAAKVSGQLAANLQNNPGLITKAVVQAAALGTTLEQTASQAEKLLDFNSSIENELKAELLTGKQLNLERARAAALAGDQVTAAQELIKNVGSLEEFQQMNVLQQKALAEAVGLTADQLAEQLKKQQIAKETGKSIAEQNKEDLLKAQKRQNLQDIFNAAVEKLSDILTVIASGPIGMLMSGLASVLSNSYALYGILGGIALLKFTNITNILKGVSIKGGTLREKIGGFFNKTKETAEKASDSGDKVGNAGKAGDGIKNTLKGISSGIASFDKVSPASIGKLALSAIALTLLTPAIPGLLLLQLVNGKLIKGALTGIGQGLSAMGSALKDPRIMLGLGVATLALMGLGKALGYTAPFVEAFGNVLTKVFTGISGVITSAANGISTIFGSLQNVDVSKLLAIGPALMTIGLGLASLGAGSVINAIGSFLGGDPIKKIEQLAASGDGLEKTATSLQNMASALTQVSLALAGIDIGKLEALDSFATNRSNDSVVEGISSFITTPIKAIDQSINSEKGNDLTPMINAINEVKAEVAKLANRPININMDGRKVGSGLTQGSYKLA